MQGTARTLLLSGFLISFSGWLGELTASPGARKPLWGSSGSVQGPGMV